MRPIRDITAVKSGSVLYHSAFGFARVTDIDTDGFSLRWERHGENLPVFVSHDNARRVYSLCRPNGFFAQAIHAPAALKERLQADPAGAIELLVLDLNRPQSKDEVHDWLVGLGMMSERGYRRWWINLGQMLRGDSRFHVEGDILYLERGTDTDAGPIELLESANQPPGRRLDLALANRDALDPDFFRQQVLLALRGGGTQVRELALATLRSAPPDEIIEGLLEPGPDNVDALIHVLRRGGWSPDQVSDEVQQLLLRQVLGSIDEGGPLDREGRLAATLIRWGCHRAVSALSRLVEGQDGRRLIRATLSSLPPRRGEEVGLALLNTTLAEGRTEDAEWLASEVLAFSLVDAATLEHRISDSHPAIARWLREDYRGQDGGFADFDNHTDESSLATAEVYFGESDAGPIPLSDLPPRSGTGLLQLGLALARALAAHHKNGWTVNPTMHSVRVNPDDTMEVLPGPTADALHLPGELPSPNADVYAAGVLLVQVLLGRPWPRMVPPSHVIPYLQHTIPMIPPSALAPLDAALHPDPRLRPQDGLRWLAQWQAAAVAEETRTSLAHDDRAQVQLGYDSHIGRVKVLLSQVNQDAIFTARRGPMALMVLCDGISTANAGSGDIASGIASQILANLWEQAAPRLSRAGPSETRDFIDRALVVANRAVCEAALRAASGDLSGRVPMGTTCTIALINGNRIELSWLGDSRAYLVGPYGASLLTADENQASERLRAWYLGMLPLWDPVGFALIGYIGHFDELQRPEPLAPHHASFKLLPGERLLICSDGVTDYIGDPHPVVSNLIASQLFSEPDPDQACRNLVDLANRGGGGDNASIIICALSH